MAGSGLSPLALPELLCSGCGEKMTVHEPDKSKISWPYGYHVLVSCHRCKTTFQVSLNHVSARNMLYLAKDAPAEDLEEIPEAQ